jgi:hypothetical protein
MLEALPTSTNPVEPAEINGQPKTEQPEAEQQEREIRYYYSGSEYLHAFELSPYFQQAFTERMEYLRQARRDINYDDPEVAADIRESMIGSDEYIRALHSFFWTGDRLPVEGEEFLKLPEKFREAIQEYWRFIDFMNRTGLKRLLADYERHPEILREETYKLELKRDQRHMLAAQALLEKEDLSLEEVKTGRQIVSLMTEVKGLDRADPNREELKARNKALFNNNL